MAKTVLKIENVSKLYRLGEIGTGTLSHDLNRWWHRVRGKEDPYQQIGTINQRDQKGDTDYVWALKDINLEVKEGEILGIIGANGAGKSTLLKILSKVTAPTTGRIRGKGKVSALLEVGTGFHPELTARENIYLNGAILGMRRHEVKSQLDEIVDFAGIERYLDTPIKRFSSGMKVRLGFAVAAHLNTDILIVDEVLAVGDAEFQQKCIGKMGDISQGEGKTVLFVSHNMKTIQQLCTNSLLLDNGLSVFYNQTNKVIKHYLKIWNVHSKGIHTFPANPKVEAFIKSVSFHRNNNELTENLTFGEAFKIKIGITKNIPINNPLLVVFIDDSMGNRIFTARSEDYNFLFDINNSKTITINITSPFLVPNNYFLGILLLKKKRFRISYYKNIPFRIISPNKKEEKYSASWGYIKAQVSWKI